MTTQHSSVKGRGSEILFGAPQAVKIKPLPSRRIPAIDDPPKPEAQDRSSGRDLAAQKAATPAPSPPARAEIELTARLARGTRTAVANVGGLTNQALPKLSPEVESAFLDEAAAAVDSPNPAVGAPQEVTMEEVKSTERSLYQLPPQESGNSAADVLPPRPSGGFTKISDLDSIGANADIQSTGEPQKPIELPERDLTEEEKQQILARLGDRLQVLDTQIDEAYDLVLKTVGENADLTTECYNQLLKAREILLLQDAARIPQVEYYIEQVRARLRRATTSQAGAKRWSWLIAAWGTLWFFGFLAILIGLNYSLIQDRLLPLSAPNTPVDMAIFLPAMVWGGIGGVAAVFYSLFKHVGRRDFDAQFNLSYVGKPFLGVILGAIVYMIVHVMILTLGILPAGLSQSGETIQTATVTPWIIYFLAWACGFKENRIFDVVDRVMKRMFSGEQEEAQVEAVS